MNKTRYWPCINSFFEKAIHLKQKNSNYELIIILKIYADRLGEPRRETLSNRFLFHLKHDFIIELRA